MNNETLRAALSYLERGWSFYPCVRGTKEPYNQLLPLLVNENGKRRPSWKVFQTQLPTRRDVETWFTVADANIALLPGALSKFVALDIDGMEGYRIADECFDGYWPRTPRVKSARGWHLYFQHPGFPVRGATGLPELELRGDGASITAPPSLHESGVVYRWDMFSPIETPLAPLPDWLLEIAERNEEKRQMELNRPRGEYSYSSAQNYGAYMNKVLHNVLSELRSCTYERNKKLNVCAIQLGHYVGNGMIDEATVIGALEGVAYEIGLAAREILPTIRSGLRKGISEPAPLPQQREYSRRKAVAA
jgi:hypothetical protein